VIICSFNDQEKRWEGRRDGEKKRWRGWKECIDELQLSFISLPHPLSLLFIIFCDIIESKTI